MIATQQRLDELTAAMVKADWVALDTEADSLHAYPEKLCLLQISIPGRDELVDPLAQLDFSGLVSAMAGHELILHGSDYDLRLLKRTYNFIPNRLFDTMWAARLAGIERFGLTDLVSGLLGVHLEKGPQTANWARRPLTERMEVYARNDSRFLKPLSELLSQKLEVLGRLEWHKEVCVRLLKDVTEIQELDDDEVWRIRGSNRFKPRELEVLKSVWHWREQEATLTNRPPFFILGHDPMLDLCHAAAAGLPWEKFLPRNFSSRRRDEVARAVEQAMGTPEQELPAVFRSKGQRMTDAQMARFDELKARRDKRVSTLGIDPSLVASKSMLIRLAADWEQAAGDLMRWQAELLKP